MKVEEDQDGGVKVSNLRNTSPLAGIWAFLKKKLNK